MDGLVQWIKNMAVFYIVAALIMQLIPGKEYQKYIRVFLGIVTIILIVNPVSKLLSKEATLDEYLSLNYNLRMEEELKEELRIMGNLREQVILEDYIAPAKKEIENYVNSIGALYLDSVITVETNEKSANFGKITKIIVKATCDYTQSKELLEIEIKKYLANFYNLDNRNINVNISDRG